MFLFFRTHLQSSVQSFPIFLRAIVLFIIGFSSFIIHHISSSSDDSTDAMGNMFSLSFYIASTISSSNTGMMSSFAVIAYVPISSPTSSSHIFKFLSSCWISFKLYYIGFAKKIGCLILLPFNYNLKCFWYSIRFFLPRILTLYLQLFQLEIFFRGFELCCTCFLLLSFFRLIIFHAIYFLLNNIWVSIEIQ